MLKNIIKPKGEKIMIRKILSLFLCFTLLASLGIPFNATAEETENKNTSDRETFKSHFINGVVKSKEITP